MGEDRYLQQLQHVLHYMSSVAISAANLSLSLGYQSFKSIDLKKEAHNLTTSVFATGLLVHEHSVGGGHHQMYKLTGGQQIGCQLFDLVQSDIETRGDDTALVDASNQVDDDLSGSVIINDLEVTNVAVL